MKLLLTGLKICLDLLHAVFNNVSLGSRRRAFVVAGRRGFDYFFGVQVLPIFGILFGIERSLFRFWFGVLAVGELVESAVNQAGILLAETGLDPLFQGRVPGHRFLTHLLRRVLIIDIMYASSQGAKALGA